MSRALFRRLHARSGLAVTILVSRNDVDSLCALKILVSLLRDNNITYSVFPVAGYDNLYEHNGRFGGEEERAVVLLNCGATDDLGEALGLTEMGGARAWVIDCHRPINHRNLSESNRRVAVLVDDEDMRERLDLDEQGALDSDSDEDDEDDDSAEQNRARKARRAARAAYYLRGNFFGRPCGSSAFELAKHQYKHDTDMVWHSLVALEDHFLHDRMTRDEYERMVETMQDEVRELEGSRQAETTVRLEDGTTVSSANADQIVQVAELRLPLLRHWSLYESLMHSQYVATKLHTWTTPGQQKVNTMLAQMGVALSEARQRYAHMSVDLKNSLGLKLDQHGPLYELDEVTFTSFSRQKGHAINVSASDVVEAASAVLELTPLDSDDGFHRALEVLSLEGASLERGLDRAMTLQRAIMRQAGQVITKRGCVNQGPFFVVDLDSYSDHDILCHPLALSRLALFLLAYHQSKNKYRHKPLIIIVPVPGTEPPQKLVMGIPPTPRHASKRSNQFELAFRTAADVDYLAEGFDGSMVQIESDAFQRFLIKLKTAYYDLGEKQQDEAAALAEPSEDGGADSGYELGDEADANLGDALSDEL